MWTVKPKYSTNLLYCDIHFIMVVWNWICSVSKALFWLDQASQCSQCQPTSNISVPSQLHSSCSLVSTLYTQPVLAQVSLELMDYSWLKLLGALLSLQNLKNCCFLYFILFYCCCLWWEAYLVPEVSLLFGSHVELTSLTSVCLQSPCLWAETWGVISGVCF